MPGNTKCPYCEYEWFSRVEQPKKCPYCQKWLIKRTKQQQLLSPKSVDITQVSE